MGGGIVVFVGAVIGIYAMCLSDDTDSRQYRGSSADSQSRQRLFIVSKLWGGRGDCLWLTWHDNCVVW